MSDSAVMAPFAGEYELSVDDLREQDIVGRSAAWRAKSLAGRWAYPVLSLALAAVTVFVNQTTTGCLIAQSTPGPAPFQIWLWQCGQDTTPSGLVWQSTWAYAADGAFWGLTLLQLGIAWFRPPRWLARRQMKRQGSQGRYRYEVAADGYTAAGPDGATVRASWQNFVAVRETPERFFLIGQGHRTAWVLPKRALGDQSAVPQLGEFLRASVAGPS